MGPRILSSHRRPLGETSANVPRVQAAELGLEPEEPLRGWQGIKARLRNGPTINPSVSSTRPLSQSDSMMLADPAPEIIAIPSTPFTIAPGRAIVLEVTPPVSINALLAQVCGGPLERVIALPEPQNTVLVEFVHRDHAAKFMDYVRRRRLEVNGCVVNGNYATPEMQQAACAARPSTTGSRGILVSATARRTLKIYKAAPVRDFRRVYSRVDATDLRRIFGRIGNVLQMQPMFYRRYVAFAIHYDSIGSAVRAKYLFDCSSAVFAGMADWRVDFVRDPAERPCVVL